MSRDRVLFKKALAPSLPSIPGERTHSDYVVIKMNDDPSPLNFAAWSSSALIALHDLSRVTVLPLEIT